MIGSKLMTSKKNILLISKRLNSLEQIVEQAKNCNHSLNADIDSMS